MKYNVGDVVKIKSIDWFDRNKGRNGYVEIWPDFTEGMSHYCGMKVKIMAICGDFYLLEEIGYKWIDDFFEENKKLELE